jgi:hypothetical protein
MLIILLKPIKNRISKRNYWIIQVSFIIEEPEETKSFVKQPFLYH